MNINISIECNTCKETTNCRVGMSNRDIQPLRFSCQTCSSPIDLVIENKQGPSIAGGKLLPSNIAFDSKTNFVGLHLDFPVSFGKYVIGRTPYMEALERVGFEALGFHSSRLDALNRLYPFAADINRMVKLYAKNSTVFGKFCLQRFGERVKSRKPKDIDDALYRILDKVFYPFSEFNQKVIANRKYQLTIQRLSKSRKEALDTFVGEITDSGFLKNVQIDCLEIYPRILHAELPLRPALFLDFDAEYKREILPFRVSIEDFIAYKDLYKDISEILSREMILIAGINNIVHRGNHDTFDDRKGAPRNLNSYADFSFGNKLSFLDNCWYEVRTAAIDNQVRNSVAHYKAEYDDASQLISYYPKREGLKQEKDESMYLLDFMRKVLISYREMHNIHQLVRYLYDYYFSGYRKSGSNGVGFGSSLSMR